MAKKRGAKNSSPQNDDFDKFFYPIEKFKIDNETLKKAEYVISYFRQFPHVFAERYLNIKLYDFQKVLLYEMMHRNTVVAIECRNLGKTYITALGLITRCILYPKTRVCVTAPEKGQSIQIIIKIKEMMMASPQLRGEISYISDSINNGKVIFHNGSWLETVTMAENSRSRRANAVCGDEWCWTDQNVMDNCIANFLGDPRQPEYLKSDKYFKKPEYEYLKEKGIEIYLSSAGHASSWQYGRFMSYAKRMIEGDDTVFVCDIPYMTAVKEGLRSLDFYEGQMKKDGFDEQKGAAEYLGIWISDSENSYYKYDMLDNCRTLNRAEYLNDLQTFLGDKDKRYAKKKYKFGEEKPNETIIIGADIASMGGKRNDLSSFCVLRLVEKKITKKTVVDGKEVVSLSKYYDRELVYLETHEGMLLKQQAERLKRLYYEYNAMYIVVDAMNCGNAIIQCLGEPTDCRETGEEYSPMMSIYEDDYASMCQYAYAKKCIVPITAGAQSNHDMADKLLGHIAQGRIKLLVDDKNKAKEYLYSIKGYDDEEVFTREMKERVISPYKETSMLINEMIALEKVSTSNNLIKLKETTGRRKDRYSSFLYANGFADILEKDLITTTTYDEDDDVIDIYIW